MLVSVFKFSLDETGIPVTEINTSGTCDGREQGVFDWSNVGYNLCASDCVS